MRFSSYLTTALAAIGLVAPVASAVTVTWDGSSSSAWTTAANWDTGSVPGSSDTVVIPDEDTTPNDPLLTSSTTIQVLHVESDGYVQVDSSGVLTVTSSAGLDIDVSGGVMGVLELTGSGIVDVQGGGQHPIDGQVKLTGSTSQFKVTTNDSSFTGAGKFTGGHDNAKIDIASGKKMTLVTVSLDPFDIEGRLTFLGSGTLDNDGKITANVSTGILTIGGSLSLEGIGAFEASGSALAVLSFDGIDSTCANVNARFILKDNATIEFINDADIQTMSTFNPASQCGMFNFDANGGSFSYYSGNCGGSPTVVSSDTTYSTGCPP